MKPIVKWSGGKKDEIKHIVDLIPDDISTYVEPFFGGGAVFFHLEPKKAVVSDVHKELVDFYNALKDGKGNEIHKFLTENPNVEDVYYRVRDEFEINTPLDNAKRFFYLRKTCYRGMLRYNRRGKFNIPYGRYKTFNFEELKDDKYMNVFNGTEILNESFEKVFERCNDPKDFIFLDPPYDSEFTDYGYCSFGKEEHRKLAECFKRSKARCMMVIGKTPFIEELYSGYIKREYHKKYAFKLHSNRIGDEINTTHIVITNYANPYPPCSMSSP
jgi:DNA adenine methylase